MTEARLTSRRRRQAAKMWAKNTKNIIYLSGSSRTNPRICCYDNNIVTRPGHCDAADESQGCCRRAIRSSRQQRSIVLVSTREFKVALSRLRLRSLFLGPSQGSRCPLSGTAFSKLCPKTGDEKLPNSTAIDGRPENIKYFVHLNK